MNRLTLALLLPVIASAYTNVRGTPLQKCSQHGMALTGFTRSGSCVDFDDDGGSHHICINMTSNAGGNFCSVTGQRNWCSSSMPCDGDSSTQCPVTNWCVCQWAFSSYLDKAGGCDRIQDIVCDSTNMAALTAYRTKASSDAKIRRALDCLESRCIASTLPSTAPMQHEAPAQAPNAVDSTDSSTHTTKQHSDGTASLEDDGLTEETYKDDDNNRNDVDEDNVTNGRHTDPAIFGAGLIVVLLVISIVVLYATYKPASDNSSSRSDRAFVRLESEAA